MKKTLFIVVSLLVIACLVVMLGGCKALQQGGPPSNPNPNPNVNPNPNPNVNPNVNTGIPGPGDPAPFTPPPLPRGAKSPVGQVILPHAMWEANSNTLITEGTGRGPGGKLDEKTKILAVKAAEADGRKKLLIAAWELDSYRKSGWKTMLMGPLQVDGIVSNVVLGSPRFDPDGSCLVVVSAPVKSITIK